jgi:post-segregation antitoxin (ccd killing protein)
MAKKYRSEIAAAVHESAMVKMQKKELERWRQQNQKSFESYNQMIEKHGLFSDDMGLL